MKKKPNPESRDISGCEHVMNTQDTERSPSELLLQPFRKLKSARKKEMQKVTGVLDDSTMADFEENTGITWWILETVERASEEK